MSSVKKLDDDDEAMAIRGLARLTILVGQQSSQIDICSETMVQDLCDWARVTFGNVFQISEETCDWVKLGYKYLGPAVNFLQTAGVLEGKTTGSASKRAQLQGQRLIQKYR